MSINRPQPPTDRVPGNHWVQEPIQASPNPEDYRSASDLAVLFQRTYIAGPYIFCPDGSHQLREGWVLREGIALREQPIPWPRSAHEVPYVPTRR